ncbi:MAG: HEAT repeat domain-containing protein [Pirellulales bacterium]
MPEDTNNFETLDLRFRVQPPKRGALPGGLIVWFILGVAVGGGFWMYGRKELANRLQQKVASESTTNSLYAIEALESLDPKRIDHLVAGLKHADSRVAKVAFERLNMHIDSWKEMELVQQHNAMRSLAEQLRSVPLALPPNNLPFLRGLAGRIYSMAMSQDDSNLKPVITICERLVALDQVQDKSLVNQIFSDSRTNTADSKANSETAKSFNVILPIAQPNAANSATERSQQPQASLYLVPGSTKPRSYDLAGTGSSGSNNKQFATAGLSDNDSLESEYSSNQNQNALPVLVRTPASISSTPVAPMKVATNSPDMAGMEKLEIAEIVRLLGNHDPNVAKAAAIALRHKGLDDHKIQIASELAVGSAQNRIRLIQQIATGESDPRPWLLWMAEDGEPEVRRMAISLLVPMADESVFRSLRILQARETSSDLRDMIARGLLTQR